MGIYQGNICIECHSCGSKYEVIGMVTFQYFPLKDIFILDRLLLANLNLWYNATSDKLTVNH